MGDNILWIYSCFCTLRAFWAQSPGTKVKGCLNNAHAMEVMTGCCFIYNHRKKKKREANTTLSILNTWGCEEGTAVIEWPRRKAKNINSGFKPWFVSAANRPHAYHTNKQPSVSLSSFKYVVHEISFHRFKELSKRYKQRVGHNKTSWYLTDKWHHVSW